MAIRRINFFNGEIYHLFNRGIRKNNLFLDSKDYIRWEKLLRWCALYNYPYSLYLSRLNNISEANSSLEKYTNLVESEYKYATPLVEVIGYVQMPNHFHLIVEQTTDNGISKYMHKLATAYAHYFNKKYDLKGSLYERPFNSVIVKGDEQFIQLLNYVLRNPLEAKLATKNNPIYKWSSSPEYIGEKSANIITAKRIPADFKNRSKLSKFILNEL